MKKALANPYSAATHFGGVTSCVDLVEWKNCFHGYRANGTDIDGYTNRFHELALLCPRMVEPSSEGRALHRGLSKNIRGDVTSSQPATFDHAIRMAYQLIGQIIQDKNDEVHEGEKRKGEGDRGGRSDNRRDYNNDKTKEGLMLEP
ncbi:hypothetical protein Tco_0272389 [Tanacetum coccineum]